MRDENEGNASLALQRLQFKPHLLPQVRIQCRKRFIEEQHQGALHQCACQRDALLLSPA